MTAETRSAVNGCGTKHFKLGCWILGLTISVMGMIAGAGWSGQRDMDARLRAAENTQAASRERLVAIQETLKKIETKLDKLTERKNP